MKAILMVLLSGLLTFMYPQETVLSLKTNSPGITGRMLNSIYQQDRSQFEKIINTLNLDVLGYYDLKNLYNTDSKREAYLESEDYKIRYSELKELKSQMISGVWHFDFEPDYFDEKSTEIKYNQETRSFSVSNNISFSAFYNESGYIQFDQILFRYPSGISLTKRNINYACVDVVEETISFEITDKVLISKIEENKNYLRLLFVFRITGTVLPKGKISNLTPSDYYLMTELQKLVVYNSKTEEIYFIYK